MTLGADPIAVATAISAARARKPIQAFSIRKESKDHGTGGRLVGPVGADDVVAVLEDTTTTGFAIGGILDGDLMQLTVTGVDTTGFITGFTWARLFSECTNGAPDCIGTGDLNALSRDPDGTLYYGAGAAPTINIPVPARYLHSHNGISSRDDYVKAVELVTALVRRLDEATVASFTAFDD